jgi:hypothetical protein
MHSEDLDNHRRKKEVSELVWNPDINLVILKGIYVTLIDSDHYICAAIPSNPIPLMFFNFSIFFFNLYGPT